MNKITTLASVLILSMTTASWAKSELDKDGDGVNDAADICPLTEAKALVDKNGCSLDEDFDGIADGLDACPQTPFGKTVDGQGCGKPDPVVAATPPVESLTAPAEAVTPAEPAETEPVSVAVAAATPAEPAERVAAPPVAAPTEPKPPRRVSLTPESGGFSNTGLPAPMVPQVVAEDTTAAAASKPVAPPPAAEPIAAPAAEAAPAPESAAVQAPESSPAAVAPEVTSDSATETVPAAAASESETEIATEETAEELSIKERLAQVLERNEGLIDPGTPKKAAVAPAKVPISRAARPSPVPEAFVPTTPPPPRNIEGLVADLYFGRNKTEIQDFSQQTLRNAAAKLAKIMQADPNLRVEVVGHADPATEAARAEKLAADRAVTVHAYLIGHGVPARRVKRVNRAGSKPLSNAGDGASNRRVEIFTYPQ